MLSTSNRRQPLSCQPCRARKIRCPRNVGRLGACATCVRRGLPPSECIFLGRTTPMCVRPPSAPGGNELASRVRYLEEILQVRADEPRRTTSNVIEHTSMVTASSETNADQGTNSSSTFTSRSFVATALQPQLIGHLKLLASGHVRYELRTCQWNSVLSAFPDAASVVELNLKEDENEKEEILYPFNTSPRTTLEDMLLMLPPIPQCDQLKAVFFQVFSPLFHILHDPTFETDYGNFRQDPELVPLSWLALLFVILSIAVTALDDNSSIANELGRRKSGRENRALLSSRYRAAAVKCLEVDGYLWRQNVTTLQALILLIYGINHTHGKTWALLGLAYNIALNIGCHIDPDVFELTLVKSEERRRCWAALQMLQTIQSTCMGHLPSRTVRDHVRLPLDVNDVDLLHGATFKESAAPTQMTYILAKFQLYSLSSKICERIFGNHFPLYASVVDLDREISWQQDAWKARYAPGTQQGDFPVFHVVHVNILYAYSHQLYLLLHRPIFMNTLRQYQPKEVENSVTRCMASAHSLLDIQKLLHDTDEYAPYRWYNEGLGSFQAFHAAITLIAILLGSDDDGIYRELMTKLRQSLVVFQELAYRSRICAKAAPIITQLLSIVDQRYHYNACSNTSTNETDAFLLTEHQIDAFQRQLRPEQWLSPASLSWADWDFLAYNHDDCTASNIGAA